MNAKEWITALVARIEAVSEEEVVELLASDDTSDLKEGEKEIGRLTGFLAKLWVLWTNLHTDLEVKVKVLREQNSGDVPEEIKKSLIREGREMAEVKDLFWFLLRQEHGLFGSVGIRKGGVIVQMPEEEEDGGPTLVIRAISIPMPSFFSRTFGDA